MVEEHNAYEKFKRRLSKTNKQDATRGKDPKPFVVKTNEEIEIEKIENA